MSTIIKTNNMYCAYWILSVILVADIGTGVVHWFEDTYITTKTTTTLGPLDNYLRMVAADNDLHHSDPQAMLQYSYLENLSTSLPVVLGIVGIVTAAWTLGAVRDIAWWTVTITLGGTGNLFHRFAHTPGPWPIKALQRLGIIQSVQQHRRHHYLDNGSKTTKHNQLTDYCVLTTVTNPILDGRGVWRFLEKMFSWFVTPNHQQKLQVKFTYGHAASFFEGMDVCGGTQTLDSISEIGV